MGIMTLAQARENFLAAMETLRSSKVRTALTVLGIVIGVSSVISMAAIIQGLNKFVQDKVESLGSRTYFLTRFPPGMDPAHMPEHIRTRKYIEYNYADFIRQAAPDVEIVTTSGTRGFFLGDSNLITSGDHSVEKVIVRGAEPEYTEAIPLFSIAQGRFISTFDQEHARSVVVLGAAISESLFPGTDAVGKMVRINGGQYEVIGVFEHDQGLFLGPGVDIFAIIPLSNFKKQYPEAKELIMIFTVPKNVNVELAQGEVDSSDAPFAPRSRGQGKRFRAELAGLSEQSVESTYRSAGDPHDGDQFDRFASGRHRSDEHHAHLRDRAHPGNWHTQGYRCSSCGYTFAVSAWKPWPSPSSEVLSAS